MFAHFRAVKEQNLILSTAMCVKIWSEVLSRSLIPKIVAGMQKMRPAANKMSPLNSLKKKQVICDHIIEPD